MTKKKGYDKSVIEKLDAVDWSAIEPGLIKYALAKERLLIDVGSGMVYIDIVKEAIARVYGQGKNGKYRNWDSVKHSDLASFLRYVIKDIVREEVKRLTGYKKEQLCWGDESGEERALSAAAIDDMDAHQYSTPENLMIKKEARKSEDELAKKMLDTINKISQEDEELGLMILCINDGKTKSAEIAEVMGFEIDKMYNLKKRLKRRLKWYKEEYGINNNSERKKV